LSRYCAKKFAKIVSKSKYAVYSIKRNFRLHSYGIYAKLVFAVSMKLIILSYAKR